MKALLLNDTRCEDHIGCELVVGNIYRLCQSVEISIIATVLISDKNPLSVVEKYCGDIDLLLLNGEGTMHDDAAKALKYMDALKCAKRRGVKCVLMNTVWQNNRKLNEYLGYCDLIFCRESLSAAEIKSLGFEARVVPDMTFATKEQSLATAEKKNKLLIIDSVNRGVTKKLRNLAFKLRVPYLPMNSRSLHKERSNPFRFLLHLLLTGGLIKDPIKETLPLIASSEAVISGRFHGVCLSMLYGVPVISLSSNTHKLEGLFSDIGIPLTELVGASEVGNLALLKMRLERGKGYGPLISEYKSEAKVKINEMFRDISALV